MLKSIYVENSICGASTEDEAAQIYLTSQAMLKEGGFRLHKFVTNTVELKKDIDSQAMTNTKGDKEVTYTQATVGKSIEPKGGEHKVLGILWDVDTDYLKLKTGTIMDEASRINPTKRTVISITSKFFDPLGVLGPIIIPFKIFFQSLCRQNETNHFEGNYYGQGTVW